MRILLNATVAIWMAWFAASRAAGAEYQSHRPMRPLPTAADRPLAQGPAHFVDASGGDDSQDGSQQRPWQSINHALRQSQPGDTIYLRGGTYYEHVVVPHSGQENEPITLRSYPGELAIIDGGLREFYQQPEKSWEPLADGASGEFVSTQTYRQFARRPILSAFPAAGWEPFHGKEDERPVVLGHFGDSMVPLHGYRTLTDLRDPRMLWDVQDKFDDENGVYCGPGLWYNRRTARIHIRLAHIDLAGLGDRAYRGQTDPRKLPLVISGPCGADVLRINGVRHFRLQDVVLRGASGSPLIHMQGSQDITFEGITVFGGAPGLLVRSTARLRIFDSAFRSLAAPWSSRASMKYRGTPSYAIITQRQKPENHDFEIARCEFTDGHDFAWLRYVKNLRFHHNYVDNFNDDGLEVGAKKGDHELYLYQNRVSRCLISLTLHEMERDESPPQVDPGSGVYVMRNVFDLRQGVFGGIPREPDPSGSYLQGKSTLCGDHGGPVWPHYYFYHNTVIRPDRAWRGYYGFGIGGRGGGNTQRWVLNNCFVQIEGVPGLSFSSAGSDWLVDGNLHWGIVDGPGYEGDFFQEQGRKYAFRKQPYPDHWMKHDTFADPKFQQTTTQRDGEMNLALKPNSPAVNAGVAIADPWPDPVRELDQGQPDIGAFPQGVEPWQVGIAGRINAGRIGGKGQR